MDIVGSNSVSDFGGFNSSGSTATTVFTKIGTGTYNIRSTGSTPTTYTYAGKWNILGGTLDFDADKDLGVGTAAVTANAITLNPNTQMITSASMLLATNRGIT